MILILGELAVAYALLIYVPRKYIGWTLSGWVLFSLIFTHLERIIYDYGNWHLGVATSFMVQCQHLGNFAWDYCDGGLPEGKRNPDQKKYAIEKLPSILEFFSAGLCPSQSYAGPSCNFMDYKNFIYRTGDFTDVPSTFTAAMTRFGAAFFWVLFYVLTNAFFPLSTLYSPTFTEANIFVKVIMSFI